MGDGLSVRCRCPRAFALALHSFEDGVVVYDEADGSLHALSPIVGEALGHLIRHTNLDGPDLALLLQLDQPEAFEMAQVRSLLNDLVELGFAEYALA